jgi:hypothetical protein
MQADFIQLARGLNRAKTQKKGDTHLSLVLLKLPHLCSPALGHKNSRFSVFGLYDLHQQLSGFPGYEHQIQLHHQLPWFRHSGMDRATLRASVSPLADGLPWDFSASIILQANYPKKCSLIHLAIYLSIIYL